LKRLYLRSGFGGQVFGNANLYVRPDSTPYKGQIPTKSDTCSQPEPGRHAYLGASNIVDGLTNCFE
jgi:hypothetical protein